MTNVTLPNTRGQAFALQTTFDDVGRGLGPVFVAMLIANFGGRTVAFNFAVLGWILCGVFNLLLYFTVVRDEAAVQSRFAESLHRSVAEDIGGLNSATGFVSEQDDADPLLCTKRRPRVSESLEAQGEII